MDIDKIISAVTKVIIRLESEKKIAAEKLGKNLEISGKGGEGSGRFPAGSGVDKPPSPKQQLLQQGVWKDTQKVKLPNQKGTVSARVGTHKTSGNTYAIVKTADGKNELWRTNPPEGAGKVQLGGTKDPSLAHCIFAAELHAVRQEGINRVVANLTEKLGVKIPIIMDEGDYKFTLAGEERNAMGTFYATDQTIRLHLDWIKNINIPEIQKLVTGVLSHEYSHHQFNVVMDVYEKQESEVRPRHLDENGNLTKIAQARFPVYHALRGFVDNPNVLKAVPPTEYSKIYQKIAKDDPSKTTKLIAIDETLAEISRIKATGGQPEDTNISKFHAAFHAAMLQQFQKVRPLRGRVKFLRLLKGGEGSGRYPAGSGDNPQSRVDLSKPDAWTKKEVDPDQQKFITVIGRNSAERVEIPVTEVTVDHAASGNSYNISNAGTPYLFSKTGETPLATAERAFKFEATYNAKREFDGEPLSTQKVGTFKTLEAAQKAVEKHALRHEEYRKILDSARVEFKIPNSVVLIVADTEGQPALLGQYTQERLPSPATAYLGAIKGSTGIIKICSKNLDDHCKRGKLTTEERRSVILGTLAHEVAHHEFNSVLRDYKTQGQIVSYATSGGKEVTQSLRDENPTYFALKSFFESDEIISATQGHTDYAKGFMKEFTTALQRDSKLKGESVSTAMTHFLTTNPARFGNAEGRVMGGTRSKFELAVDESLAEVSHQLQLGKGSEVPQFLKDFRTAVGKVYRDSGTTVGNSLRVPSASKILNLKQFQKKMIVFESKRIKK